MAKINHFFEFCAAVIFMRLIGLFPRRAGDWIAVKLGSLVYTIWGSRRQVARANLRQAMGHALSHHEIERIICPVFHNMSRTFVEMAHFVHTPPETVREMTVPDAEDRIHEVYAAGRGCVFVTAHFGNWELLGMWVSANDMPMHVVAGIQHNDLVDRMVNALRARMGVNVLRADRSGSRQVMHALRKGEFVGIVADQHAPSGFVVVDFFGRPAAAPRGPAAFAIKAGCPLWPFLSRRERYDRHVMMAGEPIYPPEGVDHETAVKQLTQRYTLFFEQGIRKYPEQWMWTHRRWKL